MWRRVTVLRAALRMILRTLGGTFILRMIFGLNGRTTLPSGPTMSRTICGW